MNGVTTASHVVIILFLFSLVVPALYNKVTIKNIRILANNTRFDQISHNVHVDKMAPMGVCGRYGTVLCSYFLTS